MLLQKSNNDFKNKNKREETSQSPRNINDTKRTKISSPPRGPFPSERLYNLNKIKSSQNLQTLNMNREKSETNLYYKLDDSRHRYALLIHFYG